MNQVVEFKNEIFPNSSRYNYPSKTAFINLSSIKLHAEQSKTSIEHMLVNHIAHEIIHGTIHKHVGKIQSIKFDNICSGKVRNAGVNIDKTFGIWENGLPILQKLKEFKNE